MALSVLYVLLLFFAVIFGVLTGNAAAVGAAALGGAQEGVRLTLSVAGAICLWSALQRLMEAAGLTALLARALRPLLGRLFPQAFRDEAARGAVTGSFCANLLGLGNAATPYDISAVRRMRALSGSPEATDEMCRFVVLNTASIQLIPASAAALRAGLGAARPFDILPAVWLSSLASVVCGLGAAYLFSLVCRR